MWRTRRSRRWAGAGAIGVASAGAAVVVAMASRDPLSRSTPVNAATAQTPAVALFVVLIGAAAVAIAAWLTLVVTRRRGRDEEPNYAPEPLQLHWLSKLVAILAPLMLGAALIAAAVLGVSASSRSSRLAAGGFARPARTPGPRGGSGGSGGFVLPAWLPWLALAIVLLAVAAVGLALARGRTSAAQRSSDYEVAGSAIDAAIDALDDPLEPREAVIAAYAAMERSYGARGLARPAFEAPREYLHRLLTAGSASEDEAAELTALFEEARYSTHPILASARDRARAALSTLRARLREEARLDAVG